MKSLAHLLAGPLCPRATELDRPFDALVVLGAALSPMGELGAPLHERVRAGVEAFFNGLAPRLVMTGAHEARAMRREALRCGVPQTALFVEERALTTRENATFSAALLRAAGWRRALVVTQPFHRRRSLGAFRRAGIECEALSFSGREQSVTGVVREYFALGYYLLRRWV